MKTVCGGHERCVCARNDETGAASFSFPQVRNYIVDDSNARSFRAALQSKGALCYDGGVDSSLRRAFGRGDGSMGQSET